MTASGRTEQLKYQAQLSGWGNTPLLLLPHPTSGLKELEPAPPETGGKLVSKLVFYAQSTSAESGRQKI